MAPKPVPERQRAFCASRTSPAGPLRDAHAIRDLALFNLVIASKLRGCDLVNLHVRDVTHGRVLGRSSFGSSPKEFPKS